MRIIALEGPSFAGKTSTLAALRSLLPPQRLVTCGCYVDQFESVDDVPPARTRSALEQLAAFKLFMRIEGRRVADLNKHAASTDLVVLDRSVDTLLAHAHALDQLFGYGVHARARSLLAQSAYLRPELTCYLDASPQILAARQRHRGEVFDSFLLDPQFIGHFRDYFTNEALPISKQVTIVHAEEVRSVVAGRVAQIISQGA